MNLKDTAVRLVKLTTMLQKEEVTLDQELDVSMSMYDFKQRKTLQQLNELKQLIKNLKQDPEIL
ncbi:hypothetical protein CL622_07320, partial [archaeon]|nr:hypothetical protein [archaeon]